MSSVKRLCSGVLAVSIGLVAIALSAALCTIAPPILQPIQPTVTDADAIPEGIATHKATKEIESERRPLRGLSHTLDDERELKDEAIGIII